MELDGNFYQVSTDDLVGVAVKRACPCALEMSRSRSAVAPPSSTLESPPRTRMTFPHDLDSADNCSMGLAICIDLRYISDSSVVCMGWKLLEDDFYRFFIPRHLLTIWFSAIKSSPNLRAPTGTTSARNSVALESFIHNVDSTDNHSTSLAIWIGLCILYSGTLRMEWESRGRNN